MKIDVTQLVKEATEAAKHAPEHLQEAAFSKAFDALMAIQQGGSGTASSGSVHRKVMKREHSAESGSDDIQIDKLDRTSHSDIIHTDSSLNNSLRLLRAAKDDLGIDGLSASTAADVLVNKFRCRVTRQAISLALNDAGRYVNRHKEGASVIFRIMAPGEEYLDSLKGTDQKESKTPTRGKSANKRINKKRKLLSGKKHVKTTSSHSTTGPAPAMSQLYDSSFFSAARTIVEITDKLKHDFGRTFKQNELSPVLLRWLRSGKLTRSQNKENQYEYKQP